MTEQPLFPDHLDLTRPSPELDRQFEILERLWAVSDLIPMPLESQQGRSL
jgi:hypothetical protein